MNKTYRLVWNELTGAWIAVAEHVKARGKRSSGVVLAAAAVLSAPAFAQTPGAPPAPTALPTGGQIVAGQAGITQSGAAMTINQGSQRAAIDWQTFNIGSQASVHFQQPAGGVALNRVADPNPSQIFGRLTATGQVFLSNPSGIYFSPSASVNVGALVATTHTISLDDFMAGKTRFERNGASGEVINAGELQAALGGYIALLAPEVRNEGVIVANMGTVALAAGEAFELQFDSNNTLASLRVDPATVNTLVENKTAVLAPGGLVILSARAVDTLQGSVVNSGDISASSLVSKGGRILLEGDDITLSSGSLLEASGATGGGEVLVGGDWQGSGDMHQATRVTMEEGASIDASATVSGDGGKVVLWSDVSNQGSVTEAHGSILAKGGTHGGDGGRIETSGHVIDVSGVTGSAAASLGAAGEWLFDPTNVSIGGAGSAAGGANNGTSLSASSINTLLNGGTSVTVTTHSGSGDLGNISVDAAVTKSSGNADVTLTLRAANVIAVNQDITHAGGTGKLNLVFDADNNTDASTAAGSPVRDGAGIVILEANLSTGGGSLTVGGTTANGFTGGDLYVGGGSNPISITTAGGNVDVKGQLIIANSSASGLTINTGGGAIDLRGAVDSGNQYAAVGGTWTWEQALADADNVSNSYLATITSSLENALAIRAANYSAAWLGGRRLAGTNLWQWVADPAYHATNNPLTFFYQATSSQTQLPAGSSGYGGTTATGYFANWSGWTNGSTSTSEPNNWNGSAPGAFSGDNESALQFTGTQGQWNDLPYNSSTLTQYVRETNLAPSSLTLNAGSGAVNINGAIGANKALASLDVTASDTTINGAALITTGAQTYNNTLTVASTGHLEIAASSLNVSNAGQDLSFTAGGGDLTISTPLSVAGGSDSDVTFKATRHISLRDGANIAGSSPANLLFWADSDNSGDGLIAITATSINTHGGSLQFGHDETATINGQSVRVGGDVYFNGNSTQTLSTGGGHLDIYGETIVSNTSGLSINSGGGNITLHGLLNSGNQYTGVRYDSATWLQAQDQANNVSESYLATITSRLENSIAALAVSYNTAWLGARRNSSGVWRWEEGPEAGQTLTYVNWAANEPNNCCTNLSNALGYPGENAMQFTGANGNWNDLFDNGARGGGDQLNYYVRETNLAESPVTINAGAGTVTFGGAVGTSKALASLAVTGGAVVIEGGAVTTKGVQTYNAPVVLGSDTTLSTIQSDIVFNSTVNSDDSATPRNLTTTITPNNTYYWVDWTSADATHVYGTISIGGETINVTYTNGQGFNLAQLSGGTNYWTGYIGGYFNGASPYTSANIANGPSASDIIQLRYAGPQTLTFSQSVENLAFSVVSMNGNGYGFNQDFNIESYSGYNGAGAGYFGGGNFVRVVDGNTYKLNDGGVNASSVGVNSEPHGTIRFANAFDSLTWNSLSNELWNGFTVGVSGTSATAGTVHFNGAAGATAGLGAVMVNAGLQTTADISGASSLAVSGRATLGGDITTAGNQTYSSAVTLNADATLTTTSNGSVSAISTIDGAHALTIATHGTGDTSLNGALGGTTALTRLSITTDALSANAISLAADSTLAVSNAGASSIAGVISGTNVAVTKDDYGTLTLSGANTYSRGTTISGGVLKLGIASTGSITNGAVGTGGVTVENGGALDLAGYSFANALDLSGTGVSDSGAVFNSTSTAVTISGATTLSANASIKSEAGGALSLNGTIDGAHALTVDTDGASSDAAIELAGVIGGATTLTRLTVSSGTADATVSAAVTAAGPISIEAGNINIDASLSSSGGQTISLQASGNVTDGASGYVSAENLVLLDGDVVLDSASNAVGTLAASGVGSLTYVDGDGLTLGSVGPTNGIAASGAISIATLAGDLTVAQDVETTDTTANALVLNAGKNTAAGTASGGDLIISGTPTISVGLGGTAKLFTGSVAGSTGLATIGGLGSGSGRFRYNSDETSTNYTTALETSLNAIYREQPTANISTMTLSMTYGDAMPDLAATGTVNGDGSSYDITGAAYSTANQLKASNTPYNITSPLVGLGYNVTGASSGTLTVNAKALTVIWGGVNKTYDGNTTTTVTLNDDRVAGDTLTINHSAAFADKNTGIGKLVNVTGVNLSGADAGNYTVAASATTTADIARLDSVTWVGGASGNWFDPANWAGGAVPDLANVANVIIPANVVVSFDTAGAVLPAETGPVQIDSLGNAGSLTQADGTLNVGLGGVTLSGFTQNGGTFSSEGNTTLDRFSQTGGSTTADGNFTVNTDFSQGSNGSVTVHGNASITDTSGGATLGNLNVDGDLDASSTDGDITQANGTAIVVNGTTTVDAGADDIVLTGPNNNFVGPFNATGGDITVVDGSGGLILGNIDASGDLDASSTDGNITQASLSSISVNGATVLDAGNHSIVLSRNNRFVGGIVRRDISTSSSASLVIPPSAPTFAMPTPDTAPPQLDAGGAVSAGSIAQGGASPGGVEGAASGADIANPSAGQAVGSPVGGGAEAIVELVKAPTAQDSGLVTVEVPTELAQSSFSFVLPVQLTEKMAPNVSISVMLANGEPIPSWLSFVPERLSFTALSIPPNSLPLRVLVVIDGRSSMLLITEVGVE